MNIFDLGIVAIPVITVIVFLIAEAVKITPLDNKWLPVICGVCGAVLGVVALHVMPEFPATDILTAIAIGIVSGLGATGAHQIYRQLSQDKAVNTAPITEEYEAETAGQDGYSGQH